GPLLAINERDGNRLIYEWHLRCSNTYSDKIIINPNTLEPMSGGYGVPFTNISKSLLIRNIPTVQTRFESSTVKKVSDSSTTGLEYKDGNSGKMKPIPGVLDPSTIENVVSRLIERTPLAPRIKEDRFIIDCLAQDEPGVLSSVTGIMAARGYSIDTLLAGKTEIPGLSRMTIGLKGQPKVMEQAKKQLESLVPVWAVLDYSHTKIIEREALLVKITRNSTPSSSENASQQSSPNDLDAASDRVKAIKNLAALFQAKICDIGPDSIVVELFAKTNKIDAFLNLVRPFGILEAVRSGTMVMSRSYQGDRVYGSSKSTD
ncbi:hypothetical protein BB560_005610, partial [Smittium megazygosporum]